MDLEILKNHTNKIVHINMRIPNDFQTFIFNNNINIPSVAKQKNAVMIYEINIAP